VSSRDVAVGSVRLVLVVAPDVSALVAAVIVHVGRITDSRKEPPLIGTEWARVNRWPRLNWHKPIVGGASKGRLFKKAHEGCTPHCIHTSTKIFVGRVWQARQLRIQLILVQFLRRFTCSHRLEHL
jgi:hypothetical protein